MKLIPGAVSRKIARTGLVAASNSPQMLFAAGIVGVIGGTVLACRATLKLDAIMADTKNDLAIAKNINDDLYTEQDRNRDIALIYGRSIVTLGRAYGPAILVGGISIAALTKSHNILNERNAALTAAYVALDKGFSEYRSRVVEKYGEDADRDLRYGTREEVITTDKGRKKTITQVSMDPPSIYAKWFDHRSSSWQSDDDMNWIFLKNQQNYLNDMLRSRGHVTLNDAYDCLGIERTTPGAIVGWVQDNEDGGDNYIDLGLPEWYSSEDFVKGVDGAVLLDFNVDGIIYDKIDKPGKVDEIWELPQ